MNKPLKRLLGLIFVLVLSIILFTLIDTPTVAAVLPTNTDAPGLPTPTFTPVPPTSTPTSIPPTATATKAPTADLSPANHSWVYSGEESGTGVLMDMVPLPAPHSWEILLSDGLLLELSTPIQICHPFRGGQFDWTGAIYLRNGSGWLEIPSTTEWIPDEEGRILICATAPLSGTYAIFGYAEPYEPVVKETDEPLVNDRPTDIDLPSSGFIIK